MPRAKQRTPALRDELVRVAVAMLADHGVAGFTTRRVAEGASTSIPAVYELFGDKGGLVREVFFEGFRKLGEEFAVFVDSDDERADLERAMVVFRTFVQHNAALAEVMFSSPFSDFDPGPDDLAAGAVVRDFLIGHVRRCIEADVLVGDATDIAHVLLALGQGLATQEAAGWLGTSETSVNRRWTTGVRALLDGFRPR